MHSSQMASRGPQGGPSSSQCLGWLGLVALILVVGHGRLRAEPPGTTDKSEADRAEESSADRSDETDDSGKSEESDAPDESERDEVNERPETFDVEREEELFEVPEGEESTGGANDQVLDATRRRDEKSLREMSKDEASEAGFEFGAAERTSERTGATLLALSGGALVHGLGHWYVEDPRTALFLVGAEGVGAALAGLGAATWLTHRDVPSANAFAASTFHVGMGVFGLSYLLDVVGVILGAQGSDGANARDPRDLSLEANYRYLGAKGYPLRHHFRGGFDFRIDPVYGSATTEQEFQFEGSSYAGTVGVLWWRGERPWTYAYLEGAGDLLDFRGAGRFQRWNAELRTGLSVDLGLVAHHLEQVAVGTELGYGRAWYFAGAQVDGPLGAADGTGYIPVEVYSHFNLSERFHLRVEYEKSSPRRLQATRRLAGIGALEMRFDSTDLLDLKLTSEFGGGFALHAGLVLDVW